MKKVLTQRIKFIELIKVYSKGSRPVWKTGTCRDKNISQTY